MAHESFEDPTVAELMNRDFIPVKVDREERPDVDAVYMAATQAMTGHGGWPMTVFATPEGEPFFCGTYFPREHFLRLLHAVAQAWRERREDVLRQGTAVAEALSRASAPPARVAVAEPDPDAAAVRLAAEFDHVNGGFGGAPKFPPHLCLLFLLRHHQRTGRTGPLEMVSHTCERMARGGIYDQLGGGFARYAVDETWTVPHFEKMLYDNALLLRVYTDLWRLSGNPLAGRVAGETVGFLLRDLLLAEGGFASALDADTDGQEGSTYVWTPRQLREVLGADDGEFAADLFAVTEQGSFEGGSSVLRLARDIDDADPAVRRRWVDVRDRLLAARAGRLQPDRDDKVVAAWNGLAVTALCGYLATARALAPATAAHTGAGPAPDLERIATVVRGAADLLARHVVKGRLRRISRGGAVAEAAGVLEDYGCVAEAFCAVHQLTGEPRWLELAEQLLDVARERFGDGSGGFFDTADDAEPLITRPADPTDNATPSGLSAVAAAMTSYAALTASTGYRSAAQEALAVVAPLMNAHARFTGYALAVAEALRSGPCEIAIATDDPVGDPLVLTAHRLAPPGAVVVAGEPDRPGVPLLAGRARRGGASTAYVCRQFVCDLPVTDPAGLAAQLRGSGQVDGREEGRG